MERPTEGLPPPIARDDSFRRGVSLDLFFAEVDDAQRKSYGDWLDQAARLGATDLELVVQWSQIEPTSLELAPSASATVEDGFLGWLMDEAHERHLRVLLTPVIELEKFADPKQRRALAPPDAKRWFWSYHRFLLHYARIAEAHKAACFAVGADLPLALAQDEHWSNLIRDVRKAYKGKLTYVARWDHFEAVALWPEVDFVGLAGLGELLADPAASRAHEKQRGELGRRLRRWVTQHHKPYLLSSVRLGFTSATSTSKAPAPMQQLDAARAFYQSLHAERSLAGVYLALALPGGALKPASGVAAPQLASASVEVLRHWYTRSRN